MMTESKKRYMAPVAIPPGETLKETLTELGMSQAELAERLGMTPQTISKIISGVDPISPETAMRLESVLGVPASFWRRLEQNYRETVYRLKEAASAEAETKLVELYPFAELTRLGRVVNTRDKWMRVLELRKFFRVASLNQIPLEFSLHEMRFRRGQRQKVSFGSIVAWYYCCRQLAESAERGTYSESTFRKGVLAIRRRLIEFDRNPLTSLPAELAKAGVTFVYVPLLKRTAISGATFWLNPTSPVIAMSNRFKSTDTFWFSFFHECAHVLKHSKKLQYIDVDGIERNEEEVEADQFAARTLIPAMDFERLKRAVVPNRVSEEQVREFSESIRVPQGIVVGRLQHDGLLARTHLNHLRNKLTCPD